MSESLLQSVVETFIRLVQTEIDPHAVMVAADDAFEVPNVPSLVLQGPMLSENKDRRSLTPITEKNVPALTFELARPPRLYHLDFEVIATTGHELDLLDLTEKVARFYQRHPVLEVPGRGELNLTELTPLGGLQRVNLSNLRQASGKCRIEDFPVWDGIVEEGKLIRDRTFEFAGGVQETRTYGPDEP